MDKTVAFVSLGCDKNLVDSEVMLGILDTRGYRIISDESQAAVIIVNTCAFIHDAKEESIETILDVADYKQTGKLQKLVVTGCLSERYRHEILEEIPEVDAVVGAGDYESIGEILDLLETGEKIVRVNNLDKDINATRSPRIVSTIGSFAYLKIAEGCDNFCTYCIIPKLRGKYRSRKMELVLDEVRMLADSGIKEIIVVAQDTTRYGIDLYGEKKLVQLVREISQVEGIEWIRLMYCYPEEITDELIEEIATNEKVVKYLDMPIQHSSDRVLKRMGRKSSHEFLVGLIGKLKSRIPDIAIRTSLIVGFPGETETDFEDLKTFVDEMKLDRVGVFTYSREEDTAAFDMPDQIAQEVKEERKEIIMVKQQQILKAINSDLIGKELKVFVEGKVNDELYIGRSYKDAPNVDGHVYFETDAELMAGDFVEIRVAGVYEYDLIGEIIDEFSE